MKITMPDGQTVFAYTGGQSLDNDLPALVFLHGAENDHSVWALQSRYFAHHGYRVLALDLPGHGASSGEPLTNINDMADWTADVLKAAGIDKATIIGHSMGSLITLAFSRRHSAQTTAIALVGSAFPMAVSDALLDAAANDEASAIDLIANWSHSGLTFSPGAPGFSIFMMSKRLMQRQRPGLLAIDFNACNNWSEGMDAAENCKVPAVAISGASDMMTPPKAIAAVHRTLSECAQKLGIASPEHVVIPNCGHAIMSEQPAALLAALRKFLSVAVVAGAR